MKLKQRYISQSNNLEDDVKRTYSSNIALRVQKIFLVFLTHCKIKIINQTAEQTFTSSTIINFSKGKYFNLRSACLSFLSFEAFLTYTHVSK